MHAFVISAKIQNGSLLNVAEGLYVVQGRSRHDLVLFQLPARAEGSSLHLSCIAMGWYLRTAQLSLLCSNSSIALLMTLSPSAEFSRRSLVLASLMLMLASVLDYTRFGGSRLFMTSSFR